MTKRIKIICGPTASGKSARALEIAQRTGGVIINADAMQVYRELRILTARPTPEEEKRAPHLLYGVLSAREACSAGRWQEMAVDAIDKTFKDNRLPIVTGGTGLYIKALMDGLADIPSVTPEARAEATRLWQLQGAAALRARDPLMEARLRPNDKQRHIRALEVLISSGRSLAYWQMLARKRPYAEVTFETEMLELPREELYRRCDARFLKMMDAGALGEARALMQLNLPEDLPAMRAVGVPELIGHVKGEWSLDEAIAKAQQATRNYAKRQVTWFKNQMG